MNPVFLVERTLSNMSLAIVMSAVGVEMSPGKLIRFPTTVILVCSFSAFYGRIKDTILP